MLLGWLRAEVPSVTPIKNTFSSLVSPSHIVVSPVRLPSGDMFDLHQAARLCLTVLSPPTARMRDAWWSVSVSDVASALPEAAAGEGSSSRWPLFTSSQLLPVFLRAKICLKLPPLSSYRMLTGFGFGWLKMIHSIQRERHRASSSPLLMLHHVLIIFLQTQATEDMHSSVRQHIVYQTLSWLGCCSFTKKNKEADYSNLTTFKLMEVLVKVYISNDLHWMQFIFSFFSWDSHIKCLRCYQIFLFLW